MPSFPTLSLSSTSYSSRAPKDPSCTEQAKRSFASHRTAWGREAKEGLASISRRPCLTTGKTYGAIFGSAAHANYHSHFLSNCETAEPQLSKPVNRFEKQLPQKRMSGRNEKTLWYKTAYILRTQDRKTISKSFFDCHDQIVHPTPDTSKPYRGTSPKPQPLKKPTKQNSTIPPHFELTISPKRVTKSFVVVLTVAPASGTTFNDGSAAPVAFYAPGRRLIVG